MSVALMLQAQESFSSINYTPSLPVGNTADYVSDFSFRGVSFEHRHFISPFATVGASFGWQDFNKILENYYLEFDNAFLYGNQYRSINAYPILAIAHYHWFPEKYFRPFAGLGVGTYSVHQVTEMGLYASTLRTWHFGLAPEIGFLYDFSPEINLLVSSVYNYGFKTNNADSFSSISFKIGIVWVRM
jgi:hypothetical protein